MQRTSYGWRLGAAALCCAALASGCADGPVPELGGLNPWVRKQWDEDEAYGPTFHSRLADLSQLRSQARSASAAEQERISRELAAKFRSERSSVMRAEILRSLAEYPTYEAQTTLLEAINDAEAKIRIVAAHGLGRRQCPESLTALGAAVGGDTDLDVRLAAGRALANFHDPAAIQALSVALEDHDPALQRVAMESLGRVSGRDYGTSLAAWREFAQGGNPQKPPGPSLAQRVRDAWIW
jgi:hypothetical protein